MGVGQGEVCSAVCCWQIGAHEPILGQSNQTKQTTLKTEGIMADYVSLSRSAFSRGVKDVLSLKPLRDAASSAIYGKTSSPTKMAQTKTRTVTVVRSNDSGWHVKRAN